MAVLNPSLLSFIGAALAASELGIVLEMDADDIRNFRANLDLPGPVDLSVQGEDGRVHVYAGPVEVVVDGHDVIATLELPGPDLQIALVDGQLEGPRFVPEGSDPLRFPKRGVVRAVAAGELDDDLRGALTREKAGQARGAVLTALERRLEVVKDTPPPAVTMAPPPAVAQGAQKAAPPKLDPLRFPKRGVVRAVNAGELDDDLEELLAREAREQGRTAVLKALRRRLEAVDA